MRYKYDANLQWREGISNNHTIDLRIKMQLVEFLTGKNIAAALAMNQSNIRREIKRVLVEEILPEIFKNIGASPVELKYNLSSKIEGSAMAGESRTPQGIDVQIRDQTRLIMEITTDRQVTALQALAGISLNVADGITSHIMAHLMHKYLGVTNHDIRLSSSMSGGKLTEDSARHKGDPAN
ncbi:hypothetical protein HYW84_00825 [Candidatus Peregrinibacteria bacterium]|nr:hypothetical protein [Candidatus Peregrinibacteria bacterium]